MLMWRVKQPTAGNMKVLACWCGRGLAGGAAPGWTTQRWLFSLAHVAHANVVPGLFNGSHLLVEVDELDQLLLQDSLPADGASDEAVQQQVRNVGPELEVLDQTPAGSRS